MNRQWKRFHGEYEKIHYDISLYTGEEYLMCYPNAGNFHTLEGTRITGEKVQYIRESKDHPLDVL
jgi:hypothetical protein